VRANSIEALDLIGSANSYLKFVRFVLDPDPRVRYAATHALAHAGRERLIRLCIVVSRFEDPLDVEAALFLLDNLKTLEALSTFKEFITHDHPGIRHRARCGLVSLASVRSEEARDILENATLTAMPARPENVERGDPRLLTPSQYDALNDPDPLIRLEFVLGLEACTEPEAVTAMVQRLKVESDPRVQATMVRVLGIRGNSRHLDLVEEFLSDPHDRVRANAVEAYAHLGSAQQRLQLRRFLDDSCRRVVGNTILALWRRGQHAVRDRLTSLARSREPLDRLAAIYVIGIIGLEAGNLLNPLTEDADEEVARRAEDCQRILGLRSGRIVMESRACSGSKTI